MALVSLAAMILVIGPAALIEVLVTKIGRYSESDREQINLATGRVLGGLAVMSFISLLIAIVNGAIIPATVSLVATLSFVLGAIITGHTVELFLALFGPMILMSALGLKKR